MADVPKVQTVVQHDPRRADLLPDLLAALPPDAQVIADPDPESPLRSPWRCYLACLDALADDASHLLIIQDDVTVCRDFPATLERVVAARPDDLVCLFVPGVAQHCSRILAACNRGERWAELGPVNSNFWIPVVAVVWPRRLAIGLREFAAERNFPASRWGDDANVGEFVRERQIRPMATVPSLIDHPDNVRSLVGTAHWSGANPGRVACCWCGDWSPLEVDWQVP